MAWFGVALILVIATVWLFRGRNNIGRFLFRSSRRLHTAIGIGRLLGYEDMPGVLDFVPSYPYDFSPSTVTLASFWIGLDYSWNL